MVWNHIIHDDPRYLPPEEHAALREKAEFDPIQDFAVALRKAEDEYLGRRLPGDLWTGVCKRSIEFQSDQVRVRFPLTFSEVLRVDLVAQEMTDHSKRRRR